MAPSKKKPDPISDRAAALNAEIAALEAQIKQLDNQLLAPPKPKYRSTALPPGSAPAHPPEKPVSPPPAHEPVFEEINREPLKSGGAETPDHYNDLGVRKYDLPALFERVRNHFRGPTTANPRLVNYLAAGGVQGLRPLRYEKRVARNRFVVFATLLFLLLLGLIWVFVHNH
jgi:hypothetical protein